MTPATIIERAADDGVIITLTPAGTVKTTGSRDAVARWVPTLRANRGAIVAALTKASNDPPAVSPADASPAWLIHCPDRQPVEVHFWPPATLAEALTGYPTAINAEPMQTPHGAEPEPDKAQPHQEEKAPPAPDAGRWRAGPAALPARSCRTCRHLKRPGLSDGHCGGRDDLPPAYTAGHPLRRLPDDGGANCTTWEESR